MCRRLLRGHRRQGAEFCGLLLHGRVAYALAADLVQVGRNWFGEEEEDFRWGSRLQILNPTS